MSRHKARSREVGRKQSMSRLIWLFLGLILVTIIGVILYRRNNDSGPSVIVIVYIDTTGFVENSVALSSNECLRVVNTTSYSVVVYISPQQRWKAGQSNPTTEPTATATALAATKMATRITGVNTTPMVPKKELTIQPAQSYDLSFKNGDYSFTIAHQEGRVFTDNDLDVTQTGNTSAVDSGGSSNSVSIIASGYDEEDSGGSSWWSGDSNNEGGIYYEGTVWEDDE